MTEQEIKAMDNPKKYKKRKTLTDDYINMIYRMLKDGIKPEEIFSYVIKQGYTGSWEALDNRVRHLLSNNFGKNLPQNWYLTYAYPIDITVIGRHEILKYITIRKEKKENKQVSGKIFQSNKRKIFNNW